MTTYNINNLLDKINEDCNKYKNLSQSNAIDIIENIIEHVKKYNIKINYENPESLDILDTLRCHYLNNPDIFNNIKSEKDFVPHIKFVLTSIRHKCDFNIPLVRQCNGLILCLYEENGIKCKIMSKSINEFNPRFTQKTLLNNINNDLYDIYELEDGTIINIYYDEYRIYDETTTYLKNDKLENKTVYYKGKWMIGTKNSYNAESLIWRDNEYKMVIQDIFKKYDFDINKLDKSQSYVMGFKHPAFHPFNQPDIWLNSDYNKPDNKWIKKLWIIQGSCLETDKLDKQKKVTENITELMVNMQKSFKDYLFGKKEYSLGLMLRTKDESKTGSYSDILLESSLWTEIRKLIYHIPKFEHRYSKKLIDYNFKDMLYVILASYLDIKKHQIFIKLFPQFKRVYETIDSIIKTLAENIYKKLNGTLCEFTDTDFHVLFTNIYNIIANMVETNNKKPKHITLNENDIKKLIINTKYTDLYYKNVSKILNKPQEFK